jgi:hypothetical protein
MRKSRLSMGVVLAALILIVPLSAQGQNRGTYNIFTVVRSLDQPTDVKADWAGNLYFCDWSGRIFRLTAVTGKVAVVAGTGTPGFSGDGGPAIDAQLGGPGSLVLDAAGDIYFADPYNYRVRKITRATGIIETVAGNGTISNSGDNGPALEAGIGMVSGVAVDGLGNLYFTDGGSVVRKVTAGSGIITTCAGTGTTGHSGDGGPAVAAEIDQPNGLALDLQGNLYIAARGEHRIRKVNARTGVITTIAGDSVGQPSPFFGIVIFQGGFSGDGGPATSALLNDPENVAVDAVGDVYISDTMNSRIRKVDAKTGVIDTIAGTGVDGYTGDVGPALDAEMSYPAGIAIDPWGIYFADLDNGAIRALLPRPFFGLRPGRPSR